MGRISGCIGKTNRFGAILISMGLKPVYQGLIVWGFLFFFIGASVIYGYWQKNKFRRHILESPAFASGHFAEFKVTGKNGLLGYYFFIANDDETHGGSKKGERLRRLGVDIFKNSFPVIYNSKEPTKSEILVFPDDFSDFGLAYPDSLSWVKEIMDGQ
jgi:hypothetical protein